MEGRRGKDQGNGRQGGGQVGRGEQQIRGVMDKCGGAFKLGKHEKFTPWGWLLTARCLSPGSKTAPSTATAAPTNAIAECEG